MAMFKIAFTKKVLPSIFMLLQLQFSIAGVLCDFCSFWLLLKYFQIKFENLNIFLSIPVKCVEINFVDFPKKC